MPDCSSAFRAVWQQGLLVHSSIRGSLFLPSLQQLLTMREELKQREAELEKSMEDKQQLKNQVQSLKEGLQNLQNTHIMQVSTTKAEKCLCSWNEKKGNKSTKGSILSDCISWESSFLGYSFCSESEHRLICTLIRKKLVLNEFQGMKYIAEINRR